MEQILNKLSEIEAAARHITEDAEKTRQALSEEAENRCRDFDKRLEEQTAEKIRQIRIELEKEKDARLTTLRSDTEKTFSALDSYYEKNHESLSDRIFSKILNGNVD